MPVPSGAPRIRRSLAREDAYAEIRRWIVEGELAPGERIQDSSLAEALGVSRMPVREALLRLESEGLVESSANRWIRVAPVSAEEGEQIYPVIWTLECLALRIRAERPTPADLAAMDEASSRMEAAIGAGDGRAAHQADSVFHGTLVDGAGNGHVSRILADLRMRLRRLEIAYFAGNMRAANSVDEHRAILDALRQSDLDTALSAVEANWRRSLERYRRQLDEASEAPSRARIRSTAASSASK